MGHQPVLVSLSILAVVVSASTASVLAVRAGRAQQGRARQLWRLGASLSLAAGIWSMHFIGMVALELPFAVSFDPWVTAFSFIPALAAGLGLVGVARRQRISGLTPAIASGLTALGIVVMHYSGMSALMVSPGPRYTTWSILGAFAVAWITCLMAFRFLRAALRAHHHPSTRHIVGIGITMGLSASSMHYLAMTGTVFSADTQPRLAHAAMGSTVNPAEASLIGLLGQHVGLALLIFMLLLTVNLIGILVSVFDHRLEDAHQKRAEALALANRQLDSRAQRLTQALAREKTVFEAAVDATQDCIWSWQPDRQELFLSTHLHGLLGTDPHYSMATIEELEVRLHTEDRPVFRKALQAATEHPEGRLNLRARLRQSDGGWRWVLFRARMVRPRPKAAAMLVGAISDVQAQQKAEEEARQLAEQQRELAALRSRIIRILSHELRTPLAVVTSSTDLIEAFSRPESEWAAPKLSRYFKNIHEALDKIDSILNDAIQFNRLETAELMACFDWADPVAVVHEASRWACESQQRPLSQIEIKDHGFKGEIQTDSRLLELVVRNLLTNALKYGQNKTVVVELQAEDDELRIDIIDQGLGIPESQHGQLFRAFFRGSNVGALPGTGLGLSIAHRAAEAIAGQLSLVTSTGHGSRFRLTLHGTPRLRESLPGR